MRASTYKIVSDCVTHFGYSYVLGRDSIHFGIPVDLDAIKIKRLRINNKLCFLAQYVKKKEKENHAI